MPLGNVCLKSEFETLDLFEHVRHGWQVGRSGCRARVAEATFTKLQSKQRQLASMTECRA